MASKPDETVKVVVRIRPISQNEERDGHLVAAKAFPERSLISVKNPKANESEPSKEFVFDAVFDDKVTQKYIYDVCASGVVESVLEGYNGTIFAYGQTGAGKTHTMEGRPDPPNLRGIIPNSFQHIFDFVASATDKQFLVRASYLEIYNEEIRDLLAKDPKNSLDLKENIDSGVYVKDLTSLVVKNISEIDHVMQAGKKNRSTGATLMNATSSRSHSIFTIVIECMEQDTQGDHIRVGKLNLVDLAGSERQSKTGATGDRLKEATKINLSLTALGNVITALVDAKTNHIPYRDSKLTRLLQNSLGGNAKTVMCANCGPADYNYDETISTLRYANRAKNIKNKPKINEDPKDAMLREYQDEIKALRKQLEASKAGVMIDEQGNSVPVHNARKEIVEKIVEREVIKEVKVGLSDEELEEIKMKAQREKELLMKQAQDDMKQLIENQKGTAKERAELQAAFDREAADKRKVEQQQKELQAKLKNMEEKLLKGGEVIAKASKQDARLRKAERELHEKAMAEATLARELAAKEEANLQLEEHFTGMSEEVEVKTKKLKKLWSKYQAAVAEAKDLQEEFNTEKNDMLDTIRQLTTTLKLKDLIISNFIPIEFSKNLERRAVWNQDDDAWVIPKMELSGTALQLAKRPTSNSKGRRPETEFSKQRRQYDNNPRFRSENILSLEFDGAERTTQEFSGAGMKSKVDHILGMDIDGIEADYVEVSSDNGMINPFQTYGMDDVTREDRSVAGGKSRSKSGKKKAEKKIDNAYHDGNVEIRSSSSRPKSAVKKRDQEYNQKAYNDYPNPRGLVRK